MKRRKNSRISISETPKEIRRPNEYDIALGLELDPHFAFKFLTTSWCCYVSARKETHRLGHLQEQQNDWLKRPTEADHAINSQYREAIYTRTDKFRQWLSMHGYPVGGSAHRSNSDWHEIHIDLCFYAPLRYMANRTGDFSMLDTRELLAHSNVPEKTRKSKDPFHITLGKDRALRLDGRPVLLKSGDRILGIPGIEMHMGTMTARPRDLVASMKKREHRAGLWKHIDDINLAFKTHAFEKHYGFDRSFVPILTTTPQTMEAAMLFQEQEHGPNPNIGFAWIPDLRDEMHYPKPEHYDPEHVFEADTRWLPHENYQLFRKPWKRVGHADIWLTTFSPTPPPEAFNGYQRRAV